MLILLASSSLHGLDLTTTGEGEENSIVLNFPDDHEPPQGDPTATPDTTNVPEGTSDWWLIEGDSNSTTTTSDGRITINNYNTNVTEVTEIIQQSGDQDNDVPTLEAILSAIGNLDSDDDNPLLTEILYALQPVENNESDNNSTLTDSNYSIITQYDTETFQESALPTGHILTDHEPSGSPPSLTIYVPSIANGSDELTLDFEDAKFSTALTIGKLGLTAVVCAGMAFFTFRISTQMLST